MNPKSPAPLEKRLKRGYENDIHDRNIKFELKNLG